ncbi:MAG: ComF family protein [Erysipelotrichaceae bacterium]
MSRQECLICSRACTHQRGLYAIVWEEHLLCGECEAQMAYHLTTFEWEGIKITSMYEYTPFLEALLFQFKEGRDIVLAPLFLEKAQRWLDRTYQECTMVFAPSQTARTKQRGFFPLEELFASSTLPKVHAFEKVGTQAQKTLSKGKRALVKQSIRRNETPLPNHVVLVDDVMSTGATLKACYELLVEQGHQVEVFVIAVNKDENDCKKDIVFTENNYKALFFGKKALNFKVIAYIMKLCSCIRKA